MQTDTLRQCVCVCVCVYNCVCECGSVSVSVCVGGGITEADKHSSQLYLKLLDADLLALLLGGGQHVVKSITIFLLFLLSLHLFLNNHLHICMKDFSGFDPLTEPTH